MDVDEESLRKDTYDYDSQIANPDPDITGMTNFYEALVYTDFVEEFDISQGLSSELYDKALQEVAAENPDDAIYQYLLDYHNERD